MDISSDELMGAVVISREDDVLILEKKSNKFRGYDYILIYLPNGKMTSIYSAERHGVHFDHFIRKHFLKDSK